MQHSSIYALFIRALPFIFTILFSACSQEVKKTEYTHTIPADATEVSAINLNALAEKAGFKEGQIPAGICPVSTCFPAVFFLIFILLLSPVPLRPHLHGQLQESYPALPLR